MRILILGTGGMLGSTVFRFFSSDRDHEVFGTARSSSNREFFDLESRQRIHVGVDILEPSSLVRTLASTRPDVVINCIGIVKQLSEAKRPETAIPVNALFPHELANLCRLGGARLIHVSTDCVFSGRKGNYVESDFADADDLYGRSKFLGEICEDDVITMRTSIIGHELSGAHGLIDWFLSQSGEVKGFRQAIFSGLPTVELARVIGEHVLSNRMLSGVYHVAASPINKYELLKLVAEQYEKKIRIEPDDTLKIDRSLNAAKFNTAAGYKPPAWTELVRRMYVARNRK